jgi:uncharacterized protein YqgQ
MIKLDTNQLVDELGKQLTGDLTNRQALLIYHAEMELIQHNLKELYEYLNLVILMKSVYADAKSILIPDQQEVKHGQSAKIHKKTSR